MKLDPDEVAKLARLAESRGGKVLGIGLPDDRTPAQCPESTGVDSGYGADAAPTVPGLAPGRHEFTIPNFRPATINELTKRGDYRSAASLKKWDRQFVSDAALIGRVPKAIRRRRVSAEVTMAGRMRPVDPDAIWKSLLDALVAAGLLVDDSSRWVEIGTFTQVRGKGKATRVVLEDMEDA